MKYLTTGLISWDRIAYLEKWAVQQGCGAVVSFVGIVRPDRSGSRQVRILYYEAYPEMAERKLNHLASAAKARWLLEGVQIQHRIGFVEAGEVSLAVVVSAQHRLEAYAASEFLVEQIKHEVPIWKRELYDDGASQWVVCAPGALHVMDVHAHL